MKLDRYMFYNIYIEDIEWLDDEYGLYFTNKTGFFIFSRVKISRKSFLTSEINIFIVKSLNFLFITFLWFFNMILSNVYTACNA